MSIRPIEFNENTQVYRMFHDELNHEFDVLLSDLQYSVGIDSSPQHGFVVVPCLVCDSSSTHPVGGGAAPPDIQLLFSRLVELKGCPCQLVPAGEQTEVSLAHTKLHCSQMDGLGRWQVEANAGPSLQVLIDSNQYTVGLGPFEAEPTNYTVVNLGLRSGEDAESALDTILKNTYTKHQDNTFVKAEAPVSGTD